MINGASTCTYRPGNMEGRALSSDPDCSGSE